MKVCDFDNLCKFRVSHVHDAPKEEPRQINDLSDSDEPDDSADSKSSEEESFTSSFESSPEAESSSD